MTSTFPSVPMGNAAFPTFTEFFSAVHGFEPYVWQRALADFVSSHGRLPDRVDVPTGLGKTAAIDVAVWGLARQLAADVPRTLGQRIFHVVERRIVVDGAYRHVLRLAEALADPGSVAPIREVARALRTLGVDNSAPPLAVTSFHGSRRDDRSWLQATGAAVIVSTATQLTLRLLGRAPGFGSHVASIHAGLAGMDSVILFDEPHLATVQVATIRDVVSIQGDATGLRDVPVPMLCLLGATIPPCLENPGASVVAFEPGAETGEALTRWTAPRPLTPILAEVEASKHLDDALVRECVKEALRLQSDDRHPRPLLAVIVNSVANARAVHKALSRELKGSQKSVHLLTSRTRTIDRPATPQELVTPERILVATQTVEVGADFTVDALVSEIAPWPVLTQRLGRLNRDGLSTRPAASVVIPEVVDGEIGTAAARYIYGEDTLAVTARGLLAEFRRLNPEGRESGRVNAIPAALERQHRLRESIAGEYPTDVWALPKRTGHLTAELAAQILETSSINRETDDMTPWLDGPDSTRPAEPVTLVWRTDLRTLDSAPPLSEEAVQVSVQEALHVAAGSSARQPLLNDAGAGDPPPSTTAKIRSEFTARRSRIRILRSGSWIVPDSPRDITPGTTMILDAELGGYTVVDGVHAGSREPVADRSLAAALRLPDPVWVPINEGSLDGAGIEGWARLEEILTDESLHHSTRLARLRAELVEILRGAFGEDDGASEWSAVRVRGVPPVHAQDLGFAARRAIPARSAASSNEVHLAVHSRQVEKAVGETSRRLRISADVIDELEQAAFLHDHGKAVPEFQTMLGRRGDDPVLAKSTGRRSIDGALAGLPEGFDHAAAGALAAERSGASPLTCHLIAAHHGGARGVTRGNAESAVWAERYRALSRRFGPWGLALLEAIVRLEDWTASAAPVVNTAFADAQLASAVLDALDNARSSSKRVDRAWVTPSVSAATPLTGLVGRARTLHWYAAVGVLATVSRIDPHARMRWDRELPEIVTEADVGATIAAFPLMWKRLVRELNANLDSSGYRSIEAKNHRLKLTPSEIAALTWRHWPVEAVMAAHALWCTHLGRVNQAVALDVMVTPEEMTASERSEARCDAGEKVAVSRAIGVYQLPIPLLPRNSTVFKDAGDFDPNIVWDPTVGWSDVTGGRGAAGLDMPTEGSAESAHELVSRSGLVPLALFGALSLGIPTSPNGGGSISQFVREGTDLKARHSGFVLPLHGGEPLTLAGLAALTRAGRAVNDGEVIVAKAGTRGNENFSSSYDAQVERLR